MSTGVFIQPGRTPSPAGRDQTSGKGKDSLSPHLLQDCKCHPTASNVEALQNRQDRLKNPLQVHICKRKTERETPKGPILNFSQGDKILWFLGPIPLRPAKQGDQKLVQEGRISAPPSFSSHTELRSATSRKELTLLHRLAPPLKQTASSSETIHYWT